MQRRLLLTLLLLGLTAASSSFSDGSKKDSGTCSSEAKCTAGGEEKKKKEVPKKPRKTPIDISVMWKKPDMLTPGHFYDEEKYEGKTALAVLKKLEEKPRVLETRCSQITGVCYEVVDVVRRDEEKFQANKWEMLRQVQLQGHVESHFGRAVLVKPQELNWKTYDTKKWAVNKYSVVDREIQAMIGGMTGSGAIPRNESAAAQGRGEYQVLLVGLGTPVIPNFLEQYHWIDMIVVDKEPLFEYFAKKWFGMRKHPNLRILQADPVSFMAYVVAQRHEVDAVFINQCKDYVDPRPCPADVYLERGTMDIIKNVVREETGMLGVNARSSEKKHVKEVANAYEGAFPMCFDYPGDHSQLFFERYKSAICFNREHPPFWLQSESEFMLNTHHEWFFYI